jgi:hypothetical protein
MMLEQIAISSNLTLWMRSLTRHRVTERETTSVVARKCGRRPHVP